MREALSGLLDAAKLILLGLTCSALVLGLIFAFDKWLDFCAEDAIRRMHKRVGITERTK